VLINAQVSATLANSFSPGYPILASGDLVQKFPTSSLSNLKFELVDGNFRPIKLLNPMYLSIDVKPIEQDLTGDVSQWHDMLPVYNTPKVQEAKKQAAEQQQQAQQAEQEKNDRRDRNMDILGEYFGKKLEAEQQEEQDESLLQTVAQQTPELGDKKAESELTQINFYLAKMKQMQEQQQQAQWHMLQEQNQQAAAQYQEQQMEAAKAQATDELAEMFDQVQEPIGG
jgi:hypothetical protein